MSVPGFQQFMLPLLRIAADGEVHRVSELLDRLAAEFGLTEGDRSELISSGQRTFDNRVGWAKTYLTQAYLLEKVGQGRFRITDRGLDVLSSDPVEITSRYLSRFPEFAQFTGRVPRESAETAAGAANPISQPGDPAQTPDELLEASYQRLRRELAAELLAQVRACSPRFFERLVVDLLVAMGYGGSRKDAGEAIGQSGDEGIDGIIKEDKLGLDVVYIQAKRWQSTVGRPVVHAFAGSLEGQRARRGVLITTSQFSQDAKEFVNRIEKRIVLIDGEQLAQLMIDHGVGVTEVAKYTVKRVDGDYFNE